MCIDHGCVLIFTLQYGAKLGATKWVMFGVQKDSLQ